MLIRLDSWASPPPTALTVVSNDVPAAASAPATEGSQEARRHPLHGTALSLVGGDITETFAPLRRALKPPLLLLDSTVPPPSAPPSPVLMLSRPSLGSGEGKVLFQIFQHGGIAKRMPPLPPPPPPPTIPCPAQCGGTPILPSDDRASDGDGYLPQEIGGPQG